MIPHVRSYCCAKGARSAPRTVQAHVPLPTSPSKGADALRNIRTVRQDPQPQALLTRHPRLHAPLHGVWPVPYTVPVHVALQVNYPLARSIRWRWLLRRLFELAITLTALAIIIGQYVEPTVANSIGPLQKV